LAAEMKFYVARENGHRFLHHRKDDAKAQDRNFETIDVPTDLNGLKSFIQELYSEIDTATDLMVMSAEPAPPPPAAKPSYVDQSVNWDALFPTLPLAHQLHFAAMAMENARERL
jgi:hypothetical protein